MPVFIVVLSCFPLGSPATVYYSIRSVTDLGWFPLEMSHRVCLLLSSVVISLFSIMCGFIVVLRQFPLGSPHHVCSFLSSVISPLVPHHVFHGCPLSFSPWFSIMSVHSCPVIFPLVPNHVCPWLSSVVFPTVPHHVCPSSSSFSPWFPICSLLSPVVFPMVPHLFIAVLICVPLGSPSVYRFHLCSPWFLICLSLSSFVFPLVPHLFVIVFICVPLGSPSCRCSFFAYSPWFLCSHWFPICLSLSSVVFPLVPHDFPWSYSLWFLHHVCSSVQQSTGLGGQTRHVSLVDLLKSQCNFKGFLPAYHSQPYRRL